MRSSSAAVQEWVRIDLGYAHHIHVMVMVMMVVPEYSPHGYCSRRITLSLTDVDHWDVVNEGTAEGPTETLLGRSWVIDQEARYITSFSSQAVTHASVGGRFDEIIIVGCSKGVSFLYHSPHPTTCF